MGLNWADYIVFVLINVSSKWKKTNFIFGVSCGEQLSLLLLLFTPFCNMSDGLVDPRGFNGLAWLVTKHLGFNCEKY